MSRRAGSDVRAFRLRKGGEELVVVSVPLERPAAVELTAAEWQVAEAIVGGASNAEIARRRGTSVRTVANQVASVLRRLGVQSRTEVAARLARVDFGDR